MTDVSRILRQIDSGDLNAAEQLLPLVYDELRKLAARKLAQERPGHTLQATALVHEAYVRLVRPASPGATQWGGRAHFFAAAAEAMRRILVENARRKARLRHGGNRQRVRIEELPPEVAVQAPSDDILSVHEALDDLERHNPQAASVVKFHYFVGLSFAEVAELMGTSERTAFRSWSYARAWLFRRLDENQP